MENVLIIAEHDLSQAGGIQAGIMNNTKRLNKKYHFDIVVFSKNESPNELIFKSYGEVYRIICDEHKNKLMTIKENLTRALRIFTGVYSILGKKKYKIIHIHDINKGATAILAAKLRKVPIRIAQCHNPKSTEKESPLKPVYISFLRWILNNAANCKVGCSKEANSYMFKGSNDKTYVINNELDLRRYQRSNPVNYDGLRFVHIGRFTEQKNHAFLLDVFAKVHEILPEATLFLVGYGILENAIRKQILHLGIKNCVKLLPFDTDGPTILDNSDYMIFPSFYEGFGRVLIEAQAMEVKCFASDVIPKTTDAGLCTYIPLSDGAQKWADLIVSYIKENKRLKEKLDRSFIQQYDADKVAERYEQAYRGELLCQANT